MDMHTINIDKIFNEKFPDLAKEFSLSDIQKLTVSNIINGNNTLCIMPTGGGKSLIYWLSGLSLKGITIVISPLIALIDEQAQKINEQGYEVLTIHGGMSANQQVNTLKKFSNREINPDFIFVSPERISMDGLFEYVIKQRKDEIKLIAIDEVHCVSQWGTSFRPFYKRIPIFLDEIYGKQDWEPRILALTATLNSKEISEICTEFKIEKNNIITSDMLMRTEISLKVLKFNDENEKEGKFWDILRLHKGEKTLVYIYRKLHKRGVEDLAEEALKIGLKAIAFHGDMSSRERQDIISKYKNNEIDIVFATNAFGMGIDIPDIEVVIHFMAPESVEQYYQEVGRSARNIDSANAYLLYTDKNIQVKRTHFINRSFPTIDELKDCYNKITNNKRGLKTVQYYSDEQIQKCLPYFLDNNLLKIKSKGFSNLKMLSDIQSKELERIFNSTKAKSMIRTIKNTGKDAQEIVELIYSSVIDDRVKLIKGFDKCLIIEAMEEEIPTSTAEDINRYISERKDYKNNLLDYLVYLLDDNNSSMELHQEIGFYLGVPKFKLNLIHSTLKGDMVRSKSEVIIANLLFQNNIKYEYEEPLYYSKNKLISPDFTIYLSNDKKMYWEHLGMIGVENYDIRWLEKLDVYENYFPGMLIKTYEGGAITDSTMNIINKILQVIE